jgi:ribosomal protein L37E
MDVSSVTISAITLAFGAFSSLVISLLAPVTTVIGKDYRELSACFRCGSMAYKVKNYTKLVSTSGSSKRVTIAVVNDDDYSLDSDYEGCELLLELD